MADLINIQCPKCQAIHSVAAEYLYKKVRCSKCKTEFAAYEMKPPNSADDWRKNTGVTPAEQLASAHDDDVFAMVIVVAASIFLAGEIVLMIVFALDTNPSLPSGPIEMALAQKQIIIQTAKMNMALDGVAIVVTLILLLLACILNVLKKIYRLTR